MERMECIIMEYIWRISTGIYHSRYSFDHLSMIYHIKKQDSTHIYPYIHQQRSLTHISNFANSQYINNIIISTTGNISFIIYLSSIIIYLFLILNLYYSPSFSLTLSTFVYIIIS